MKFKLFQIKNLNLLVELKFLNKIMGREDPVEFYICFYLKIYYRINKNLYLIGRIIKFKKL